MKLNLRWELLTIILFLVGIRIASAQVNVVLAIDSSKSMQTSDKNGYRFSSSEYFMDYFSFQGNSRAGIVAFGNTAKTIRPFDLLSSDDIGSYDSDLRKIEIQTGTISKTEIGKGLALALEMMDKAEGGKNIVLVSDGKLEGDPSARSTKSDSEATRLAMKELVEQILPQLKEKGIKVYAAGLFGSSTQRGEGESLLKKLAEETGGFYSEVTRAEEFPSIFDRIKEKIDGSSKNINLSPGTQKFEAESNTAIITVKGKGEFKVTAPDGSTYPTGDKSVSIINRYILYEKEGLSVLYLHAKDSNSLEGTWTVESPDGVKFEVTPYAKLVDTENSQREFFFVNEVFLMSYAIQGVNNKLVKADSLNTCQVDYEITRTERDTGDEYLSRGTLVYSKDKGVFLGESENEFQKTGNYKLNLALKCGEGKIVPKFSKIFQVVDGNFTKIELYNEKDELQEKTDFPVDSQLLIKGRFDDTAVKSVNVASFTFTGARSQIMSVRLIGSSEFAKNFEEKDKQIQTNLIPFNKVGTNTFKIDILGDIYVQRRENAQADRFPVKIRTTKTIKIKEKSILDGMSSESATKYGTLTGLIIVFLYSVYRAFRKFLPPENLTKKFKRGGFQYRKNGSPDMVSFQKPHNSFFRDNLKASVGFANSGADIEIKQDGEGIFMDVIMDSRGNFYVSPRKQYEISRDGDEPMEAKSIISDGDILEVSHPELDFSAKLRTFINEIEEEMMPQ